MTRNHTTMKFSELLHQRDALLRQARLANLAYAHQRLSEFAARITRARLRGPVTLSVAAPGTDRLWPILQTHEANASVFEEHFLDEDVVELADILAYLQPGDTAGEFTFRLEELGPRFLPGLRRELDRAGIAPDPSDRPPGDSARAASASP
jgi:hypothetical protein